VSEPEFLLGRTLTVFVEVTLQQDMLAVLVVRAEGNHTLITVHPGPVPHSARTLAHRLMAAGQGVYWGNLISRAHDPVFMLLIVMWSAIYAWDEAMTALYTHVTHLEASALVSGLREIEQVSPQVHAIRSHLLWYDALLDHFKKSLEFIGKAGPMASLDEQTQETARMLLKKEIKTLLNEVDRLHRQQEMLDDRLSHVMKLVVSILSIKETQASQKHSESMKQMYVAHGYRPRIAYMILQYISHDRLSPRHVYVYHRDSSALTHALSVIATVFGMNIKEIVPGSLGDLHEYLAIMIPLTIVTIWLAGFMTVRVERPEFNFIRLVFWPTFIFLERAAVVLTSIRTVYFRVREHAWSARETLRVVDDPLPKPRALPRSRSRDHSRPRSQHFDAHPNGHIPSALSRPNSGYLNQKRKPDATVRWNDSRPHSVASSRLSLHSFTDVERTARSPDAKPLGGNYELQSTNVPILMHTPPSDPVVPTRSNLGRGYARGGATGGERGGFGTEAAAPNLLRPVFADRDFALKNDGGRSDYAPSDVSTRPPTPGE